MTLSALSRRFGFLIASLSGLLSAVTGAPFVTGFTPDFGPPGTQVTIFGSGFRPTATPPIVYFGSTTATASLIAASQTVIQCVVPDMAVTGPITVYVQGFGQHTTQAYFYVPPRIQEFGTKIIGQVGNDLIFEKPVVATQGGTLTVIGDNFYVPNSSYLLVRVGDTILNATATAQTQIPALLPPLLLTGYVSVFTAVGGTTNFTDYVYGPPRINRFTSNGVAGSTILVQGYNFLTRPDRQFEFRFNGVKASSVNVLSNTNMEVVVPEVALTGPLSISVPGGSFITSSNFTVLPKVNSFTPIAGSAGTVVTLNGSGLNGTTQVKFGQVAAPLLTNISQLQITAVVPGGVQNGPITVTTTNGTAVTSELFYVAPTIGSFSPSSGNPGTVVTVNGQNLSGVVQVQLNNVVVPGVAQVSNQQLTFQVPANATSGKIKVITPGGTAESASTFTLLGPGPVITSFTPTFGAPGTAVTISGVNLTGATNVTFNGVAASFTIVEGTKLQATVPATATTGKIRVATPDGSSESTASFTVGSTADVRILFAPSLSPAVAFAPVIYNIQAQNSGPLPAENTVIEFEIPAGMTLMETIGSVQPDINGNKLTYNRGQLDPGSVFLAAVRVSAGSPATVTAIGRVSTTTPDSNGGNNTREVVTQVALHALQVEYDPEAGILLSWPSAAGPYYQLNSAGSLQGSFDPTPGTPVDDGSRLLLTLPPTEPRQYFRLELLP